MEKIQEKKGVKEEADVRVNVIREETSG